MKKTAWIPAAVFLLNGLALFPTTLAAQSGKPVFIDSPAYVLSGNNGGDDTQPTAQPAPATATPQPTAAPQPEAKPTAPAQTVTAQPKPTTSVQTTPKPSPTATIATAATQTSATATQAAKDKEAKTKKSTARQGKLVYISVDVAQVFNWYAHINLPYNTKGARAIVNPTVSVDFDMGHYIFLGTGLSFNTTGGRLQYPSDYVEQYKDLGFSAYDEVLRAYTASYLELPLVFRMQTNLLHNHWRVYGQLSGHFGVRVFTRYRDTYENFKFQGTNGQTLEGKLVQNGTLDNKINPFQVAVGARLGGSYQLLKIMALRFGVGYRYGCLNALTKNHEQPSGVQCTAKPQQFEIFLGVTF